MKCLDPAEIYFYLEEELADQKKADVKSHLASCRKCRQSMEKKQHMLGAIKNIPRYKTPKGFTDQIMSKIEPVRPSLSEWFKAGAAAVIFISVVSLLFFAFSKQGLADFSVNSFQSAVQLSREALVTSIKFLKSVGVLIHMGLQLIGLILKSIHSVAPVMSTEIQIFTVLFVLLIALSVILSLKQKYILGDKR
jgi:hypothetical protein